MARDAAPARLHPFGDDRAYDLADDLVAVRPPFEPGDEPVAQDVAVRPPAAGDTPPAGGPVYREPPTGRPVVPSGRVLVRFREGASPDQRRAELESSGYRLERVLPYAPHAAWVRSTAGTVAAALNDIERLRAVPGVEHVEPELIGVATRR